MILSLFARRVASSANILRTSCASLLGLCSGLLSDGELSDREILYLKQWLEDNEELSGTWPGDVLLSRVDHVLADRQIDGLERGHLIQTLQALIDDTLDDDLEAGSLADVVDFDDVPLVKFSGQSFCFVGQFLYGSREACTSAVEALGATITAEISEELNYVVVGTIIDKHGSKSKDIERIGEAKSLRDSGADIRIIDEQLWAQFLP